MSPLEAYKYATESAAGAYDAVAGAASAAYDAVTEKAGEAYDAVTEVAGAVADAVLGDDEPSVPQSQQVVPAPGPTPLASTYASNDESLDVQGAEFVAASKPQQSSFWDFYNDPAGAAASAFNTYVRPWVPESLQPYLPDESEPGAVASSPAEPTVLESVWSGLKYYLGFEGEDDIVESMTDHSMNEQNDPFRLNLNESDSYGECSVDAVSTSKQAKPICVYADAPVASARMLYEAIPQPWYAPNEFESADATIDDSIEFSTVSASAQSMTTSTEALSTFDVAGDEIELPTGLTFVSQEYTVLSGDASASVSSPEVAAAASVDTTVAAPIMQTSPEAVEVLVREESPAFLLGSDTDADAIYYRNVARASWASEVSGNKSLTSEPSQAGVGDGQSVISGFDVSMALGSPISRFASTGHGSTAAAARSTSEVSVPSVDTQGSLKVGAQDVNDSAHVFSTTSVAAGHAGLQAQQLATQALEQSQRVLSSDPRAVTVPLFPQVLGQGAALVDSKNRDLAVAELTSPLLAVESRSDAQSGHDSDHPGRQSEAAMAFDEIAGMPAQSTVKNSDVSAADYGTFRPNTQDVFVLGVA